VKRPILATAIVFATFLIGPATPRAADDAVPKRRPGLWEITTVSSDTGTVAVKACIGADDKIATPDDSGACTEPKASRAGDSVLVDVVCKRKYGREIMSTAFTGDFATRYHAIMKITYDPPDGMKNLGAIIDGKYLGPDCGGAAQ
jgi:hypothetical protein